MRSPRAAAVAWIIARFARLRFPVLFSVVAVLFVLNVLIPDAIPFVDEILLGLAAALLGSWKKGREVPPMEPGNAG